ncbi:hypothetical protein HDU96_007052 [Phlyctochytrium bullatum]|nr:hypothetical protein HDU96_007052 [Phlyctochytrium bullatum]
MGLASGLALEELDDDQKDLLRDFLSLHSPDLAEIPLSPPPPPPLPSRITLELFASKCPKTVDNFLRLCDGSRGLSKTARTKPLHFLSAPVHRIAHGLVFQTGDITRGDGSGGDSIYNGKFNDEKPGLKIRVDRGSLVMANAGKNSNTSQWCVVIAREGPQLEKARKALEGKHVVFGRVVEGWEVLERMENAQQEGVDGAPLEPVFISGCGVLHEPSSK